MKKFFLRNILWINSNIVVFSLILFLLSFCPPINAGEVRLPDWQSTNAGKPSSTSSYTYRFTTSSSGSTLSFDWRVSSEWNFDFLIITLDGAEILKESSEQSSSYSKDFYDDNEHELVCTYSKDDIVDKRDDCASVSNVIARNVTNITVTIPNNTIYYTSYGIPDIIPARSDAFGVNIISNTYENGQGIITFDGEVTSIGDKAFSSTGLTSIIIPNSVTSIGESAFFRCYELHSITIPNSLTSIGDSAFCWTRLTSITIPNSVTSIGESAFFATNLTSITIPNSVTSIGDNAFGYSSLTSIVVEASNTNYDSRSNCNAIIETATNTLIVGCQNTIIPNSVTSIGDYAFFACSGLTSDVIPNSVTSIGNYAFYRCTYLTSINIPNTVTSIGDYAFGGLESLTSITIPNSVKSIGKWAFVDCFGLTSITIPNSVTSIGENPFTNCNQLASISVENGNVYYDSRDNCNAIIETATNTLISGCRNTIIPNSVTSIGEEAFFGASFTSITVPNSVTSIGDFALSNTFLKSITIPSSVKSIGRHVFLASVGMVSITNLSTIPQSISSDALEEYNPGAVTLHVLPGCKDVYENAEFWNRLTIVEDAVDPFATIALVDGETYSEGTTQENKNITYTRTFNNTSWQALYIPFSMSYDDWKDDFDVAFINSVRQYDNDEDGIVDETIMDIMKIKSGSLIPNTPYLIKAKSVGEKTITVSNTTLYKAEENSIECSTMLAKYIFTGTYSTIPSSTMAANNYYAMGGGKLVMTDGSNDLKPYRWYLNIESRSPLYNVSNAAKAITINVVGEEEATGISQMTSVEPASAIYDLNGRKMAQKTLKPGLYIKNGKKVIIK